MADIPYADIASFRQSERNYYGQYVTTERQKWRDRMREIVVEVSNLAMNANELDNQVLTELYAIRAEMTVRLNMIDNNDRAIVQLLTQVIGAKSVHDRRMHIETFEESVSLLLKEDWERVKSETRPIWRFLKPVSLVDRQSKRVISKRDGVWSVFVAALLFALFLVVIVWSVTAAYRNAESMFDDNKPVVNQTSNLSSPNQQSPENNTQQNKSKATGLDPLSIQLPPLEGIDQQLLELPPLIKKK